MYVSFSQIKFAVFNGSDFHRISKSSILLHKFCVPTLWYSFANNVTSINFSINDIDYQQFLDDLFPKSWHININPLSGAAAASPACHQNRQKFNIKDTLENWLAFYINLLDKVDILRETSYKFVVFGTAAKNLKEYRLWNTMYISHYRSS